MTRARIRESGRSIIQDSLSSIPASHRSFYLSHPVCSIASVHRTRDPLSTPARTRKSHRSSFHILYRVRTNETLENRRGERIREREREKKRGWKQRSVQAAEHVNLSVSRVSLLHLINASVNRQTRCGEMALDGNSAGLESEGKRA